MYEQPLVSIIMNCHNGEKYLQEAIDSVLAQTYLNWELIFWDNHSTDRSAEIFKRYHDQRLLYYYAPKHYSLNESRNYAIEVSRGELIAFLDTDDMWVPQKLEKQIKYFKNGNVGVVYGNYWFLNGKKYTKKIRYRRSLPSGYILNELLCNYVVGLLTIVIRRKAFECLENQFETHFSMIGDFDLTVRLAVEWDFVAIQEPIACYRWHGENTSIKFRDEHSSELEKWYEEMQSHPVISQQSGLQSPLSHSLYLKAMKCITNHQIIEAFKIYIKLPICKEKLKLSIALLIPGSVLKFLRA